MAVTLTRPPAPPVEDEDAPMPYSPADFRRLAATYPDLRMERTKEGEIVIMPPALTGTGNRNFKIALQLGRWIELTGTGEGFDSSTGFTLPNGAERSPDVSWVERSRWEALTVEQREDEFAPICPDFVIELRSKTDRRSKLQEKMREYIANGVRLGWLIDPRWRRVEVYRPGREVEVLENPPSVSGEGVLPGFVLDLTKVWD